MKLQDQINEIIVEKALEVASRSTTGLQINPSEITSLNHRWLDLVTEAKKGRGSNLSPPLLLRVKWLEDSCGWDLPTPWTEEVDLLFREVVAYRLGIVLRDFRKIFKVVNSSEEALTLYTRAWFRIADEAPALALRDWLEERGILPLEEENPSDVSNAARGEVGRGYDLEW